MKRKTAIVVPYAIGQNEPSRPLKQLFIVPNIQTVRDQMLRELFSDHVCNLDEDDVLSIREGDGNDYGDIIVSFGDDIFMYLTFVEE